MTDAVSLRDVTLTYNHGRPDEVKAIVDLSLDVPHGQFVTIVGSNGAGKSSLIQVVSGAARATSGQVFIDDKDVTRLPDYRRAGLITRVFDDPRIGTAAELSIEDNLALAMSRGRRRGLRLALNNQRRETMRTQLAQLELGLEDRLKDPVGLLSAGQRQSLTMVMAGLVGTKVLLLDEHLSALDPNTVERVLDLTVSMVGRMGCAALMVTHNMTHAVDVGDRVIVMSRGQIVADFSGEKRRHLTVEGIVGQLTEVDDSLSDRSLLEGI